MEENPLLNIPQYNSPEEFMGAIQKLQYINNPLNELATSSLAIVYYGVPCCNLKCLIPFNCLLNCCTDCGDNFIYNTLIHTNGEQKYLFKNVGRLDCKLCSCDNMDRFSYCKSFNIPSFDQLSSNLGSESVEMVKEKNCNCCSFCSTFFDVNIKPENRLVGIIRYKGDCDDCCKCDCDCCGNCCCFDCCCVCKDLCKDLCKCGPCQCDICYKYYYCCDILSSNKELMYTIFLKIFCLSYCRTDCLNSLTFSIRSPNGINVGQIEMRRNCCNCCGLFGKSCTYTINFPSNATPEMKLTIINAIISIDMFVK